MPLSKTGAKFFEKIPLFKDGTFKVTKRLSLASQNKQSGPELYYLCTYACGGLTGPTFSRPPFNLMPYFFK